MYCEAMRRIPGNENFKGRIEYTTIVKHYFGNAAYICSQIGLNGALQSLNVISVIQSAQVGCVKYARFCQRGRGRGGEGGGGGRELT